MIDALVTEPGTAHSARVERVAEEAAAPAAIPIRVLEVGICGTDREIAEGLFGLAPAGERELVLGHELLGVIERDGDGFTSGDLVTATVRRSCGRCDACAQGSPDSCLTGDYVERGITRLHGFARELVLEDAEQLITVPRSLGRLGVLAEPASICARGIRHARAVAGRQPWPGERALVLGAGAIGMLSTYLLRLDGVDVWTAARRPGGSDRAALVEACGARYVSTSETPPGELAEQVGGFDLVLEATGDAQVMAQTIGLLRRNGVACLLGLDGRDRAVTLDGRTLGVDTVLQNRAFLGSVNAHRRDWLAAVDTLDQALGRWPDAVQQLVGLRVPLDRFAEAFAYDGVKATLVLSE
jgi:threonine dehydrogenase-like Zn-dependent dehydrogenase